MDESTQLQAELLRRELARREMARQTGASEPIAQASGEFGGISKPPTLAQKIGTNLTSKKTGPLGVLGGAGVVLGASGIPEEDVLPMVGQGVGGMATGFTGSGFLGATTGATLGQGARQVFKTLRGEKPDFGKMGSEALTTGAVEGITRGAGNVVFRRQIANETLGNLGKKLGEMKESLSSNPNLKVPTYDLYSHMTNAFDTLPEPMKTGKVAQRLKAWSKYLSSKSDVSAKDLISMEEDLGKVASYGEMSKGAFIQPSEIPNVATNKIAKSTRNKVSETVDALAESSGQKGFGKTSKKISKLLKDPDKTDVTKTHGNVFGQLAAGGAVGGLTQNPLAGLATFTAMRALQSPQARNLAFKALRSPVGAVVDSGTKLSLSEIARRVKK